METVSFVLPITFKETGVYVEEVRPWRHSPDECAVIRTRLFLTSFLKFFDQGCLGEFVLVCPPEQASSLGQLVASLTADRRYRVVSELEICPDVPMARDEKTGKINGWYVQQLIKLAYANHTNSEFYVTLDSDLICLKPFAYPDLINLRHAVTNTETLADYERIYTSRFSRWELSVKTDRYSVSAKLLGYERPEPLRFRFYGETPNIYHAQSVRLLTNHLGERFSRTWSVTLAQSSGWTEQGIYFQFLEMRGMVDSVCMLVGCNNILDLERSVWQPSINYRQRREYDATHFLTSDRCSQTGIFVAIQSYLRSSSWLPERYGSLVNFYQEIEGWVLRDSGRSLKAQTTPTK